MKKLLLIPLALTILSGCTTPAKDFKNKMEDWDEYGYYTRCNREVIDGVECILCSEASNISIECNFK